jgi:hypothetical protein
MKMKIRKLQDSDVIRFHPFLIDGVEVYYINVFCLFVGGKVIYELDDSLIKEFRKNMRHDDWKKTSTRYLFRTDTDEFVLIGNSLFKLISNQSEISKINLNIKIVDRQGFPDYSGSYIKEDSEHNKIDLIDIKNEPLFINRFVKNQILIEKELGYDIIGQSLSNIRDKKLDQVLDSVEDDDFDKIFE